ncbi:haloacid dehalogenase type II [Marinobacter sp. ANT_B65]|uniref:haloacid dehalogenase type II n=1 Tax=Marinobacter sp. ANT_B65 TaxID=2039467 RepID=UPI000BBE2B61|nr:haloacid dehalogenase type II [Marinobacter sp. ANT_B65]PCM45997.1 haloacid dehalogenase type II [Marinobacter sp. ANT_B65]
MPDKAFPSIIVFDVNETLLDITTLEPLFDRIFGDPGVLREWFAQLVLYSQAMTLAQLYTPFGELGIGALKMTASIHGVGISDEDVAELKERMSSMPAHQDVVPALTRLQNAGFRMVTLTNSASAATPTPLEQAGISHFFEKNFNVSTVGKFKPAPETYHLVATELSVETSDLCLLACHLWDTIGAQAAGCQGAFLARPYNAPLSAPNVPIPDLCASDLITLADEIIRRRQGS